MNGQKIINYLSIFITGLHAIAIHMTIQNVKNLSTNSLNLSLPMMITYDTTKNNKTNDHQTEHITE
jgi:hypothetical protein